MPVKKEEEEDILLLYPGREEPRAQDDVKSCHQLEVFVEVPTLELVDHRRKLLKLEGGEETKPIMVSISTHMSLSCPYTTTRLRLRLCSVT